jgi:protein-arginine kinase activator protein McsA
MCEKEQVIKPPEPNTLGDEIRKLREARGTDNLKKPCAECGENEAEVVIKDGTTDVTEEVCRECAIRCAKSAYYQIVDVSQSVIIDVVHLMATTSSRQQFFTDCFSRGVTCRS